MSLGDKQSSATFNGPISNNHAIVNKRKCYQLD